MRTLFVSILTIVFSFASCQKPAVNEKPEGNFLYKVVEASSEDGTGSLNDVVSSVLDGSDVYFVSSTADETGALNFFNELLQKIDLQNPTSSQGQYVELALIQTKPESKRLCTMTYGDVDDSSLNSLSVYGEGVENIDFSVKASMYAAYDESYQKQSDLYEIVLEFYGKFYLVDNQGERWSLRPNGTLVKGTLPSELPSAGVNRLRIDTANKKWESVAITMVRFKTQGGETSVIGKYAGRGVWNFDDITFIKNEKGQIPYLFEVSSTNVNKLKYFCNVSNSPTTVQLDQMQKIRQVGGTYADEKFLTENAGCFLADASSYGKKCFLSLHLNAYNGECSYKVILKSNNKYVAGFMGDSITAIWNREGTGDGKGNPAFFTINNFFNKGISGNTTDDMLARFDSDMFSSTPSIIVILAGTNDIAGNDGVVDDAHIINNIQTMAKKATDAGCKVILCSILPCKEYAWKPSLTGDASPKNRIPVVNALIKKLCQEKGYEFCDYYAATVDPKDPGAMIESYTYDNCHPTQSTYPNVLEPLILTHINKVLTE